MSNYNVFKRQWELWQFVPLFGFLARWGTAFGALVALILTAASMRGVLLRIPPEILTACAGLVVLAVFLFYRMLSERGRALQAMNRFLLTLGASRSSSRSGLDHEAARRLFAKMRALEGRPREWWRAIEDSSDHYESSPSPSASGASGWFLVRSASEFLTQEFVLEPNYHGSFHQSVPGILSALGLLATFTAILISLAGVSYNAANVARPVTGIDTLINGLAGKFLSSILALVLSVIFTLTERKYCDRALTARHEELVRRVQDALPLLAPTRVLLDIHRVTREGQRAAAQAVAAEPAPDAKYANSFESPAAVELHDPTEQAAAPEPARPVEPPYEFAYAGAVVMSAGLESATSTELDAVAEHFMPVATPAGTEPAGHGQQAASTELAAVAEHSTPPEMLAVTELTGYAQQATSAELDAGAEHCMPVETPAVTQPAGHGEQAASAGLAAVAEHFNPVEIPGVAESGGHLQQAAAAELAAVVEHFNPVGTPAVTESAGHLQQAPVADLRGPVVPPAATEQLGRPEGTTAPDTALGIDNSAAVQPALGPRQSPEPTASTTHRSAGE